MKRTCLAVPVCHSERRAAVILNAAGTAVRAVALPVRGGIGPGVVTLAWLRAAGRAGCGRRALPAGSPGALLMLAGGGLRPGRRVLLAWSGCGCGEEGGGGLPGLGAGRDA